MFKALGSNLTEEWSGEDRGKGEEGGRGREVFCDITKYINS